MKDKRTKVKDILTTLLDMTDDLAELVFDRKAVFNYYNLYYQDKKKYQQFKQNYYALERNGYLTRYGETSVKFSNKAKIRILENLCEKIDRDNNYRFISFDIPEKDRYKRDQFRKMITQIGFRRIQASLWVIDKNVGDLIETLCYDLGIEKYVVYIASAKTDIDGIIGKLLQDNQDNKNQRIS